MEFFWSECGKLRTRKTPNTGTSRSDTHYRKYKRLHRANFLLRARYNPLKLPPVNCSRWFSSNKMKHYISSSKVRFLWFWSQTLGHLEWNNITALTKLICRSRSAVSCCDWFDFIWDPNSLTHQILQNGQY